MKFVEFKEQQYHNGGYCSCEIMFSIDNIARVVECVDDYHCTNIVTKDSKVHTVNEEYSDVIKKIREAEGVEE